LYMRCRRSVVSITYLLALTCRKFVDKYVFSKSLQGNPKMPSGTDVNLKFYKWYLNRRPQNLHNSASCITSVFNPFTSTGFCFRLFCYFYLIIATLPGHMNRIFLVLIPVLAGLAGPLFAQERTDKTAVTYEQIFDEPYAVNKLFIGLQPFYGEAFATNVNAGFGLEAQYWYQDKASFRAHFRKSYSRKFFDMNRDLA